MTYAVKLLKKEKLTHDVFGLTLERPSGYSFSPGQFLEFTLQEPRRPSKQLRLSFTGLNSDPDLHVAVKTHPALEVDAPHLNWLEPGEEVRISEPKDEVVYRGPGVFIAGGTGISPFMAIFRQLEKDGKLDGNMLVFANKRGEDICFEGELHRMFGTDIISVLAFEDRPRNIAGRIDVGFIKEHVNDLDQPFYVCGPEPFVHEVADVLKLSGVKEGNVSLYF